MFDKLVQIAKDALERTLPPISVLAHPEVDPKGLGDAHGVDLFLVRDGFSVHRGDFRGPRREHTVLDLDSILRYLERRGSPEASVLFCSPDGFVAVLDEAERPDIDRATMPLRASTALKAWSQIAAGRSWGHVKFRDLIEDSTEDLVEQKLALNLARFKHTSTVKYNSDLTDGASYGFQVEEKERGGSAKLPRRFDIEIPLFEGWPTKYVVSVRLDINTRHGESPTFGIGFRDLDDAKATAIEEMIAHCSEKLGDGWMVISGKPKATEPLHGGLEEAAKTRAAAAPVTTVTNSSGHC